MGEVIKIRNADCTDAELAWCAGFFEGEGCTTTHMGHSILQLTQCDPEVLERWVKFMGLGNVQGPYRTATRNQKSIKPRWVIRLGRHDTPKALERMWPFMGPIKKDQARRRGIDFGA